VRVCVIGAGASGLVAAKKLLDALSGAAARVVHSTRRGYWYVPKFIFGLPADEFGDRLVARALTAPSPRLRAAIADRQDTRYFDYLPSPRHHLEVDYLRYERDLRRLLRLAGGRKGAA